MADMEPSPNGKKRFNTLIASIQELFLARDIKTIQQIVTKTARKISGADGATFVLNENGVCYYADEDAIAPLWKGKRFPMDACMSGWAIQHHESVIVKDIYQDDRIPIDTYKPTFVKSMAVVPIHRNDPLGAIGIYWSAVQETGREKMELIESLADSTAVAIENVHNIALLNKRIKKQKQDEAMTKSELYRIRQNAAEKERKFEGIFRHSNIGIGMADANANIIDANDELLKILGYGKNELLGMNFTEFTHPDDIHNEISLMQQIKDNQIDSYRIEKRYVTKTKETVWVDLSVDCLRDARGTVTGFFGMIMDISENKLARQALTESEALYRQYFEAAPYAILIGDTYTVSSPNRKAMDLFGYTTEEFMRLTPVDLSPEKQPDGSLSKEKVPYYLEKAMQGEIQAFEWLHKKKDGSLFDAHVSLCRVDIQGNARTMAFILDITDRNQYLNELHQKNIFIETVLDNLPIGLALNRIQEGTAIYLNKKFTEIYGWPEIELTDINSFFLKVFPNKKYRDSVSKKIMEDINSGDPLRMHWENITVTHQNGEKRIVNAVNIPLLEQNTMVSTVMDVTERNRYLQEIQQQNAFIETILDNLPIGLYILDTEYRYILFNKTMETYSGLKKENIIGRNIFELNPHFSKSNSLRSYIEKSMKGKFIITPDYIHPHDPKKNTWFYSILYPNKDPDGNITGVVSQVIDITERKRSEQLLVIQNREYEALNEKLLKTNEELYKAKEKAEESDRLKTVFLNNMSHEIRTPMNGIMGFAELLDKPDLAVEKRRYYVKIINNSCTQLLHIIDDILEISKLETRQVQLNESEFSLNDLLMELFSIFNLKAKERNIPLYLKKGLYDDESRIVADKPKLFKILTNIIENALKFTHKGFIEFGYQMVSGKIELFVKDTGVGISPENFISIFQRFVQEDKALSKQVGGLGIGLSIASENAQLLGGKISLESEKGKGSTFFITIPYKPAIVSGKSSMPGASGEVDRKDAATSTILVVEDEEVNFLYIEELLQDVPWRKLNICHAKNGKEAVQICRKNKDIDLVLMDIKLPALNGYEAVRQIKSSRPEMTIVAQTAYTAQEDKKKALQAGCSEFLSKPIRQDELTALLDKYLKR